MTVQVVFHSKSLVTELTLEQLLPVVFLQVAIEVTFHSKALATGGTLEVFLLVVP